MLTIFYSILFVYRYSGLSSKTAGFANVTGIGNCKL